MRSRGQIVARGDQQFLLRVYCGRDTNGKRHYASKMFEGKRRDARRALTQLMRQADTGTLIHPTQQSFAQFAEDWKGWKVNLAASTMEGYSIKLKARLIPTFGLLKLHTITPLIIQKAVSDWIEHGYHPTTIRHWVSLLHQILQKGVELGFLVRNPADAVTIPSQVQRTFTALDTAQMGQLLRATRGEKFFPLWMLLLSTGMRPGEALGLKWDDLRDNLLTINRTVSAGKLVENHAKTDGSLRTVALSAGVVEVLKAYRRRQPLGTPFMFTSRLGSHYELTFIRESWKRALKKAGLPSTVRLYDTRHSHATQLLNAGVPLKFIADRLGHSSVKITESVYARVMPKAREEVAAVVDQMLNVASQ